MRVSMITVMCAMFLLVAGASSAADELTGKVYPQFEALVSYQQLKVGDEWVLIGCGPDTDLPKELLGYLEDHIGQTITVSGDVVQDAQFGKCISRPVLPQGVAVSFWDENSWLRIGKEVSDDDRKLIETVLKGVYWDPVFTVPSKSWLGFCRYFHDRGFSVDIGHRYSRWEEPEEGEKGCHEVTLTLSRPQDDMGFFVSIYSLYDIPGIQNKMRQSTGNKSVDSLFDFAKAKQTDQYSARKWRSVTQSDWVVIMKAVIKNGYVEEAE